MILFSAILPTECTPEAGSNCIAFSVLFFSASSSSLGKYETLLEENHPGHGKVRTPNFHNEIRETMFSWLPLFCIVYDMHDLYLW